MGLPFGGDLLSSSSQHKLLFSSSENILSCGAPESIRSCGVELLCPPPHQPHEQ
jgi:hypothetical protein